jgi:predicted O-methyltransferase YrrM
VPSLPTTARTEISFVLPLNWLGLHREYLQAGEMEIIAALLRDVEAKSMIEFGCRDGRTARVLLHNVSSLQRYIGIDVPMEYEPGLAHQRNEMVVNPGHLAAADPRFDLILRARGSLDLVADDLPPVDAAFIDGDHSEPAVLHDSYLARALVRPNGIIIWHDYFSHHLNDVTRVLDRLAGEGWAIVHIEGTWLAFRRT